MLARANRLYAELGRTLTPILSGGAADSSLASSTGTPTLDGFGVEAEGAHGPDDQAHMETLVPRTYLLARMIEDVGRDPKGK
jgi:glutamate carboxypeptidase